MPSYVEILQSLFYSGKEALYTFFQQVNDDFDNHETRLLALEAATTSAVPTAVVLKYGSNVPPSGYLVCDGTQYAQSAYPALYAAIGNTFNRPADVGSNFRVPDLRGRLAVGSGAGSGLTVRALGDRFGTETETVGPTMIPAHTHGVTDAGHTHTDSQEKVGGSGGTTALYALPAGPNASIGNGLTSSSSTTGVSIQNQGGGGAHANVGPCTVVAFIIKT